jgi:uncharacterized cupin superfamily protein
MRRGAVEASIFTTQFDEDFKGIFKQAALGRRTNAERLGISVYELAPECPRELSGYHLHYGNEELLIVLTGRPTLRTPEGERVLDEGDIAAFPAGRSGAHCVYNDTEEPVRYLMLSTMNAPDVVGYPDAGKVGVINRQPGPHAGEDELAAWFRLEDQVGPED